MSETEPAGSTNTAPHGTDGGTAGLARRHLFGLDLVDEAELATVVEAVLAHGDQPDSAADRATLPLLLTPNVDITVHLHRQRDSEEAAVFRQARFVLPDGMPMVAASRLLRRPLASRLPGSGLFELLWPRLVAERRPLVMLCADDEIVTRLDPGNGSAELLVAPWFDARRDDEVDAVVAQVVASAERIGAGHVLLGLGNPKDAILAGRLLHRWPDDRPRPLVLGLGGSFAMYAGIRRRAPAWVQRIGMEWFYRFIQEPRRLFRRYFVDDLAFIPIVAAEARRLRAESRGNEHRSGHGQ